MFEGTDASKVVWKYPLPKEYKDGLPAGYPERDLLISARSSAAEIEGILGNFWPQDDRVGKKVTSCTLINNKSIPSLFKNRALCFVMDPDASHLVAAELKAKNTGSRVHELRPYRVLEKLAPERARHPGIHPETPCRAEWGGRGGMNDIVPDVSLFDWEKNIPYTVPSWDLIRKNLTTHGTKEAQRYHEVSIQRAAKPGKKLKSVPEHPVASLLIDARVKGSIPIQDAEEIQRLVRIFNDFPHFKLYIITEDSQIKVISGTDKIVNFIKQNKYNKQVTNSLESFGLPGTEPKSNIENEITRGADNFKQVIANNNFLPDGWDFKQLQDALLYLWGSQVKNPMVGYDNLMSKYSPEQRRIFNVILREEIVNRIEALNTTQAREFASNYWSKFYSLRLYENLQGENIKKWSNIEQTWVSNSPYIHARDEMIYWIANYEGNSRALNALRTNIATIVSNYGASKLGDYVAVNQGDVIGVGIKRNGHPYIQLKNYTNLNEYGSKYPVCDEIVMLPDRFQVHVINPNGIRFEDPATVYSNNGRECYDHEGHKLAYNTFGLAYQPIMKYVPGQQIDILSPEQRQEWNEQYDPSVALNSQKTNRVDKGSKSRNPDPSSVTTPSGSATPLSVTGDHGSSGISSSSPTTTAGTDSVVKSQLAAELPAGCSTEYRIPPRQLTAHCELLEYIRKKFKQNTDEWEIANELLAKYGDWRTNPHSKAQINARLLHLRPHTIVGGNDRWYIGPSKVVGNQVLDGYGMQQFKEKVCKGQNPYRFIAMPWEFCFAQLLHYLHRTNITTTEADGTIVPFRQGGIKALPEPKPVYIADIFGARMESPRADAHLLFHQKSSTYFNGYPAEFRRLLAIANGLPENYFNSPRDYSTPFYQNLQNPNYTNDYFVDEQGLEYMAANNILLLFQAAEDAALREGRDAYLRILPVGVGFWSKDKTRQVQIYREALNKVLSNVELMSRFPNVKRVNFSSGYSNSQSATRVLFPCGVTLTSSKQDVGEALPTECKDMVLVANNSGDPRSFESNEGVGIHMSSDGRYRASKSELRKQMNTSQDPYTYNLFPPAHFDAIIRNRAVMRDVVQTGHSVENVIKEVSIPGISTSPIDLTQSPEITDVNVKVNKIVNCFYPKIIQQYNKNNSYGTYLPIDSECAVGLKNDDESPYFQFPVIQGTTKLIVDVRASATGVIFSYSGGKLGQMGQTFNVFPKGHEPLVAFNQFYTGLCKKYPAILSTSEKLVKVLPERKFIVYKSQPIATTTHASPQSTTGDSKHHDGPSSNVYSPNQIAGRGGFYMQFLNDNGTRRRIESPHYPTDPSQTKPWMSAVNATVLKGVATASGQYLNQNNKDLLSIISPEWPNISKDMLTLVAQVMKLGHKHAGLGNLLFDKLGNAKSDTKASALITDILEDFNSRVVPKLPISLRDKQPELKDQYLKLFVFVSAYAQKDYQRYGVFTGNEKAQVKASVGLRTKRINPNEIDEALDRCLSNLGNKISM